MPESVEDLLSELARRKSKREEKSKKKKSFDHIKWLSELSKDEVNIAGGKGANLAEMYNLKLPVPPAFVITAQAYEEFIQTIKEKIKEILSSIDIENTAQLEEKARQIQKLIVQEEMPKEMQDEIIEAYGNLNVDAELVEKAGKTALSIIKAAREPVFVAIRSSATTEDLASASFAGQLETFLNIKGKKQLIEAVKECWASLFTARAIYYREKKGFAHEDSLVAVIVQKMINSDKSGTAFTVNPIDNSQQIVIEAVFGLGEGVVSGRIEPDHYVVSKPEIKILSKKIGTKKIFFTKTSAGKNVQLALPLEKIKEQVLENIEIKKVANYAIKIEEHYNLAQDIEFAFEMGNFYVLQTRPVTTLEKKVLARKIEAAELVKGLGASPGVASGVVKIIHNLEELPKIKTGDVLVTKMTSPDMVVIMQKCSAIITDEGGATAHAAIVSREMGIACVVGTKNATQILEEDQFVTVDGSNGIVYAGKPEIEEEMKVEIKPKIETRTKIKTIVDLPAFAQRAALSQADGVGLLRIEGIIASSGKHPLRFIYDNKEDEYTELLINNIEKIINAFPDKPIWIRTSDIRSDEYGNLEGSPKIKEANPMLGLHGIRAALKEPRLLKAELNAIKKLSMKYKQLGVMLPQVISVEEVKKTKEIANQIGLEFGKEGVQLGVMIETPAACEIIEELCKEGIAFISFGTNDLTQYTLAIDRGNETVQYLYDELNPAVLSQLKKVIGVCKQYDIETSICGQAGSKPAMVEFLVRHGIDSISANADAVYDISVLVNKIEKEMQEMPAEEEREEEEKPEEPVEEERKEIPEEEPLESTIEKVEEEVGKEPVGEEIKEETREEVSEEIEEEPEKIEEEGPATEEAEEKEEKKPEEIEEVEAEEVFPEEEPEEEKEEEKEISEEEEAPSESLEEKPEEKEISEEEEPKEPEEEKVDIF